MHHSPLHMLNSYLIKRERPSLSLCLFYEPELWYAANQSGPAKETVSPKSGMNIQMLVCFICMGTQGRTLISIIIINLWWINVKIEQKLNINTYKVTFLLYQLLIFLNLFIVHLFRQRDCKKKFVLTGGLWLFFVSPGRWIGNKQLFKVDSR